MHAHEVSAAHNTGPLSLLLTAGSYLTTSVDESGEDRSKSFVRKRLDEMLTLNEEQ